MSEEEIKTEAAAEEAAATPAAGAPEPKKKMKKWPIVVGIVVVVLIAAGAGFWVWHEQPSFCNAICHTPMDPYVATYEETSGQPGTDKWGNEVSDAGAMMAVLHKDKGENCLACHVPTIGEQISEGLAWVSGNYTYPLEEASLEDLTAATGREADDFCLNESCHNMTREELQESTADMEFNVHRSQHGDIDCGECHKAHRASVVYCTQCHSEAEVPEGWLSASDASKLPNQA